MDRSEVLDRLCQVGGLTEDQAGRVVELLVWYSFLGVAPLDSDVAKYSFNVQFNIRRLLYPIEAGSGAFVVHPAFCAALDLQT